MTRLALLPCALVAAVLGCRTRSADQLDVVRLVVQQHFSNIPLLLADDKGYFRRHGIRIERVPLEQGSQALPLLIQGDVDAAAMTTTINLLSAVERGAHIRIAANKGFYEPGHCSQSGLVGRADWTPPSDPEALRDYVRGRKIAVTNSSGNSFTISRILGSIGLTDSEVEIVSLPENAKLEALAAGRIDLAQVGEPNLVRSQQRGFVVWRYSEQAMRGLDQSYVVIGARLYEADRDLGVRFLIGYLEGIADYLGGKTEENVAIVARETGLEPDLLRQSCWPSVRVDGEVDADTLRQIGAWALGQGLLDRAPPIESLIERDLLAEALKRRAPPRR